MVEKTVIVGDKEVRMGASALIPRLYRIRFGRDMVTDMRQLQKKFEKAKKLPEDATDEEREDAEFSVLDLTIFENIAWLMVRHAGEDIPNDPDEWLESIDGVFSIYEILPSVIDLWNFNGRTTSVPRKK